MSVMRGRCKRVAEHHNDMLLDQQTEKYDGLDLGNQDKLKWAGTVCAS